MENKYDEDIGEEIISRLKELIAILERKMQIIQNEKKFSFTNKDRN
jgi:hypothetical protein